MKDEIRYVCRYCGKEALVGRRHRCRALRADERRRRAEEYDPDADLGYDSPDYDPAGRDESGPDLPWLRIVLSSGVAAVVAAALVYSFVGIIGLLCLLIVPAALGIRALARTAGTQRGPSAKNEYRTLLVLCRWDEGLAERLIAAEIRDYPGMTRREAIRTAKGRLEADRR